MIKALPEYAKYFGDLLRYVRLEGAEPVRFFDLHPCLFERTSANPFDPHYFYLNIWASKRILESNTTSHVDVGSQVDFVGFLTCFTKVIFIDIRPLRANLVNLKCREGSVLHMPFEDGTVQSLSCLHVAEHIGLGRYGDPLDPHGTEKAARELMRILSKDGNLFFALPMGKPRLCFNAHRIHTAQEILGYFSDLDLIEFSGVNDRAEFREHLPVHSLDNCNYACGFFWFKKR
jgi:hypothetical protein